MLPIGWSIVGIPRRSPVDLNDLRIVYGANEAVSFQQAVNAGYIQQSVFGYEQLAGYFTEETLQPFLGYWFRVLRSPGVTVVFPASVAASSAPSSSPTVTELEWKLPLRVQAGAFVSSAAYLGVAADATEKADGLFDIQAPPAFGPAVTVRFVQPRAVDEGPVYLADVRSTALPQRWEFVVASSVPDAEVTLSWPDVSSLPGEVRPVLVDQATGRRRYMRTTTSMSIPSAGGYTARALAIELEQPGAGTLAVNALSASQSAQGVAIVYSLSSAAAVTAEVLNIAGRRIATVCAEEPRPAGAGEILWNMRSNSGSTVPAGTYIISFTARTETGQQVGALRTMQVQR